MKTNKIIRGTMLLLCLLALHHKADAQFFGLRTNVLALATGTINAGLDLSVSDKWSTDISVSWNPIDTPTYSTRTIGVQVGTKRWLYESFVGHFIGAHMAYTDYRIGGKAHTYEGEAAAIGISYGYAWMLSKRWNLTLEAGMGIYYMRDTRQERRISDYEPYYLRHYRRWTIAPTRAEVSFNYLF